MKPDRKKGQARNPAREAHPPARSRAEDPEPTTGSAPIPVWLFIVLAVLLFWGMLYLDSNAGGFNPRVYQRYRSTNDLVALVPFDPAKESFNKGLAVYNRPTCAPCHQPNGQGTPGLFPPLAGADWVLEKDPGRIIRIVLDGVQGPMQVKGVTYNNAMPPWRPTLTDEEIAQVITYVRQAWGNDASSVTTEEVAKVRQATASRTTPWTADELLKLPLAQ
jgi:mono/diheme cytochrome c family protein